MISALSTPFSSSASSRSPFSTSVVGSNRCNLSINSKVALSKRPLTVRASPPRSSDEGSTSSAAAGIFIGGFVLGGITVATLGCVYAPQISKALTGADRKDLMRKLPKFIYDEDKALEKTRKVLAKKIEQLNLAIDEVSSQLHTDVDDDNAPNGGGNPVNSDEIQAST